jgi:DNA-cytosine methyltransferase
MSGKSDKKLKMIDLFAGVGGISSGFEKVGFEVVSANEYKADIAKTYISNHPNTKMIVEDITKVKSIDLLNGEKEIDVIVGGPPCQGFSMAGRRIRGGEREFLNDPRNELFKEFVRIVRDIKPKVFVMENVAAMLNMHGGAVKDEIIRLFKEIGYNTEVRVLLAAEYGVPQLRKRAVFIGNRLGIDPKEFFPQKTHGSDGSRPYVTIAESILDLPKINAGAGNFELDYADSELTDYQKERKGKSKKIYNHQATKHDPRIVSLLKTIKPGEGRVNIPKELQTKSVHSGAFGRLEKNKPAYTITTRFDTPSVGRVTHPVSHRALTPREAARIQSFDDDFVFHGSKSSIGIQIGNAVPPLLAKAIASKIKKILKNN